MTSATAFGIIVAQPIYRWFIFIVIVSLKADKGGSLSQMKNLADFQQDLVACLSTEYFKGLTFNQTSKLNW